jgi:hypothetical protein
VPSARPRSSLEKPVVDVEKQTASALAPRRPGEVAVEKSALNNQTKPIAPSRPPGNLEKQTNNMVPGRPAPPPPRPANPPHRPPPPSVGKPAVTKDKDVQPQLVAVTKDKEVQPQRVKEVSQVKESEGPSLRQRLGSLKLTRKQREEVGML